MPIKLITVGKGRAAGADEWLEKLRRYTSVTEVSLKTNPKNTSVISLQTAGEGERVLKALSPDDHVVLLDERGRDITSDGLAQLVAGAGDRGTPLAFCIGGPYGHGEAVRARASESIRLSSMVLNHQIAYLVLLEQLYRSWTILRGEPYHHV